MDGKDVNEPQGEDHEVQRHQSPAEMVGLIEHSGFREKDHKHTYVTNPQSKMKVCYRLKPSLLAICCKNR